MGGSTVDKCKQDHSPWVCPMFKEPFVPKRRELIKTTGRCFQCLAARHDSKNYKKIRMCGVGGCKSTKHSSYYLHDVGNVRGNHAGPTQQNSEKLAENARLDSQMTTDTCNQQLLSDAPAFNQSGSNVESRER